MMRWQWTCDGVDWGEVEALFAAVELGGRKGDKLRRAFLASQVVCFVYDDDNLIGVARALFASGLDVLPGLGEIPGTGRDLVELQGRCTDLPARGLRDLHRGIGDVDANPVALDKSYACP